VRTACSRTPFLYLDVDLTHRNPPIQCVCSTRLSTTVMSVT
jgi:hypothetical protein